MQGPVGGQLRSLTFSLRVMRSHESPSPLFACTLKCRCVGVLCGQEPGRLHLLSPVPTALGIK